MKEAESLEIAALWEVQKSLRETYGWSFVIDPADKCATKIRREPTGSDQTAAAPEKPVAKRIQKAGRKLQ
jgi:hypothetical protein